MFVEQAEGAAIAAAVFASVSQTEPQQAGAGQEGQGLPGSEPGRPRARARKPKRRPDASPENAEDTLRIKAEAARIAAEVFAVIPQVCWHLTWQLHPTIPRLTFLPHAYQRHTQPPCALFAIIQ